MIQAVLWIIRIIGIILAVLLLTALLLLTVILFVPICYRIRAVKKTEVQEVSGNVCFLSPLVRFKFHYAQKGFTYQGKVLWYAFTDRKKKSVPNEEKKKETAAAGTKKKTNAGKRQSEEKSTVKENKQKKNTVGKERKEKSKKKKSIPEKLRHLFRQKDELICILKEPESKRALSFAWDKLKKTLRHILPRKIKGYVIYGNEDPAVTGKIFGVIAMVYAALGPVLKLMPDFEQERFECDVEFRGRLQIATLLFLLLKIYFHQELRQMIQRVKAIREIE